LGLQQQPVEKQDIYS